MGRKRKIDIEALSEEQFQAVLADIQVKVREKIKTTISNLNTHLNVYGLEVLLGVQIVKQGEANLIKEEMKLSSHKK